MIKKRIIPILLLSEQRLVKTRQFKDPREVGNPITSAKVYSAQDADELIFLNIDRQNRSIEGLIELIQKVSEVCFMPLAVGGGIKSLADAEALIKNGADKVILNSICYEKPQLIAEIVNKFGAQAVIVAIDVRSDGSGEYALYSDCGRKREQINLIEHIKRCTAFEAGELFINSIDNDGMMAGFDHVLIQRVMQNCHIPVIACGGSGNYDHLKEAFLVTNVSALGCGSIFNFADNNPIRAKSFLSNYKIPVKKI